MILISAGHNPIAKGAAFEDFNEYDEAMEWVFLLIQELRENALAVPTGTLKEKVNFINSQPASIAIEIHFNSALNKEGNPVGRGCETLYCPGSIKGRILAENIHKSIAGLFPPDRGIKEGWYQMNPAKGPDYFLKRTKCPAIILEPDFIHRRSIITGNRKTACLALASGLLEAVEKVKIA